LDGFIHAFLALVLNQDGPFSVYHYRLISLCNVVYKIITKILDNGLKAILLKFIAPNQSTFVPGRTIQDNCNLAYELLLTLRNIEWQRGPHGYQD
jgi:hypothetical protein